MRLDGFTTGGGGGEMDTCYNVFKRTYNVMGSVRRECVSSSCHGSSIWCDVLKGGANGCSIVEPCFTELQRNDATKTLLLCMLFPSQPEFTSNWDTLNKIHNLEPVSTS